MSFGYHRFRPTIHLHFPHDSSEGFGTLAAELLALADNFAVAFAVALAAELADTLADLLADTVVGWHTALIVGLAALQNMLRFH